MRSGTQLSLFFLLTGALLLQQGCSSSQTNGEDVSIDIAGAESGADPVGSIPEDMLADESLPMSADPAEPSNPDDLIGSADKTDDPFADLATADSSDSVESTSETTGETQHYTVKPGDTLMKIAFTIYGDIERWKDIYDQNRNTLKKASLLKVGMTLAYDSPSAPFERNELGHSYVIKNGDTLAGIADEVYGRKMKYKKLQRYNSRLIKNPNRIFAGFTIFYDITSEEMAEAEARRQQRSAGGGGGNSFDSVPSAFNPPVSAPPQQDPLAAGPPLPQGDGAVAPPPPPAPASTGN